MIGDTSPSRLIGRATGVAWTIGKTALEAIWAD